MLGGESYEEGHHRSLADEKGMGMCEWISTRRSFATVSHTPCLSFFLSIQSILNLPNGQIVVFQHLGFDR